MRTVLYVDDKEEELQALKFQLANKYRVVTCRDGAAAAALAEAERPAAVIIDIEMPGYDGYRVLADIRSLNDPPPVLMLSGYDEPLLVVRALREGASDFVSKPYFHTMLRRRVELMIERKERVFTSNSTGRLIGSSALMRDVRNDIAAYASASLPVLIIGESGTGKDLAAQELHRLSFRSAGPFEVRNIGAVPETLMEGELFGCEDGAYTDARARKGCFEEANGGTLFLDEIGDASATAQAALLRITEDGRVRRLGGSRTRPIDCRIVCATNRDLGELIAAGRFRSDLLYRLDVLGIKMPPLREHREDIAELTDHFLRAADCAGISDAASDALAAYDWPGNVRQLRSCLDRACLRSRGERIEAAHIRF